MKSFAVFIFSLLAMFMGDPGLAFARQSYSPADRATVIAQEMDCIEENLEGTGVLAWQKVCSLDDGDGREFSDSGGKSFAYDNRYRGSEYDSPPPNENSGLANGPSSESWIQPADGERFIETDFKLSAGLRYDEFDWNIASDMTGNVTPNIISELTWSDLKMTQLRADAEVLLGGTLVFDGMASYADIYDGDNQDSDYDGDNRTLEISRSNNNSDDGEAMDWSGGAGLRFFLDKPSSLLGVDKMWLTFLGGYSYHELNLVMTDGYQTIPDEGPFPQLHSSYWAEWNGPWSGFELKGEKNRWLGSARFEYHWADYYGSANWNLRSDFMHPLSFEQLAEGRGVIVNLNGGYHITDNWTMDLLASFQDWETDPGIVRFFDSDGSIGEQRLNEVNWESKAFMLGSHYRF